MKMGPCAMCEKNRSTENKWVLHTVLPLFVGYVSSIQDSPMMDRPELGCWQFFSELPCS
jgi:hypothetical protein